MAQATPRVTPLASYHEKLGARWTEFGGWRMPVHYSSIIEEHRCVRERVGLFDLSHMGEIIVAGPGGVDFLAWSTTNDPRRLGPGQAQYTCLCTPTGGIVDDVVLYRLPPVEAPGTLPQWALAHLGAAQQQESGPPAFLAVVNAANHEKDLTWWRELTIHPPAMPPEDYVEPALKPFDLHDIGDDVVLLALQGPAAQEVLSRVTRPATSLDELTYYHCRWGTVAGVPALIARTGYTGEDGFELYVDRQNGGTLWEALLAAGSSRGILPVGLGARDTLRMEMKYALYGNDIDETTTPLEAGLGWVVKFTKGPFVGRSALVAQKVSGVERQLVIMVMQDRAIPRHGIPIVANGQAVGRVTSGGFSPSLGKGIALGYVPPAWAPVGTLVDVEIRGELHPARVARAPLVPAHIKR